MLLATWQLIACSHGIVVLLFCDPTPLTRLCNNPPSRGVQFLLNLLSNLLSLLMRYLPNSVRSLLISQRNLPNRLLSLGNLRMQFSSLRTRRLYYLHSSPRYLVTQPSQQFSESSGVDSQALSSSQRSSRSSDQPSHLSSNSSVQSNHVADSRPQETELSPLQFSKSTQQPSSGFQSLFVFSPSSAQA